MALLLQRAVCGRCLDADTDPVHMWVIWRALSPSHCEGAECGRPDPSSIGPPELGSRTSKMAYAQLLPRGLLTAWMHVYW